MLNRVPVGVPSATCECRLELECNRPSPSMTWYENVMTGDGVGRGPVPRRLVGRRGVARPRHLPLGLRLRRHRQEIQRPPGTHLRFRFPAQTCFVDFHLALLGFNGFQWDWLGFTGFGWVLLDFYGLNSYSWLLSSFPRVFWVLLGFTGLYRVWSGLSGIG